MASMDSNVAVVTGAAWAVMKNVTTKQLLTCAAAAASAAAFAVGEEGDGEPVRSCRSGRCLARHQCEQRKAPPAEETSRSWTDEPQENRMQRGSRCQRSAKKCLAASCHADNQR